MSGEIDFDLPLWGATVYHNTPETNGVWNCAFNAEGRGLVALEKIKELFEAEGLNPVRIYKIELFELKTPGEGG